MHETNLHCMARRRFFVDLIHNGQAMLSGSEAQHLRQVLRAERGQRYEVSDGGKVYLAEIEDFRKGVVTFQILEELPQPPLLLDITLGAAIIKFERFELIVEKATELGVSTIIPFAAVRSERGLEKAVPKRLERWRRIATEAAKQSHRVNPPQIVLPQPLRELLSQSAGLRLCLDELADRPILSAFPPPAERTQGSKVFLLLGPEGGWDPREREAISRAGFVSLSLGKQILRAETAAIAALSALQFAWDEARAGVSMATGPDL